MSAIELFISHSERDSDLVLPLADWLSSSFGLEEGEVRCTAADGLPPGEFPAAILRDDIRSAKAIVGLVTTNSLRSHWVRLEMGAGWLQEHLHLIRGPGLDPRGLPSPLSDFVTVGYCDKQSMARLLKKIATQLGRPIHDAALGRLDCIAEDAEKMLLEEQVAWFSLPPVLSAWAIAPDAYIKELSLLCTTLGLRMHDVRTCVTNEGIVSADPEFLPGWAMGPWSVSKGVVNYMVDTPSGRTATVDAHGVLPDDLASDMERALSPRRVGKRAKLVREWFGASRDWLATNPPGTRIGHSAHQS